MEDKKQNHQANKLQNKDKNVTIKFDIHVDEYRDPQPKKYDEIEY